MYLSIFNIVNVLKIQFVKCFNKAIFLLKFEFMLKRNYNYFKLLEFNPQAGAELCQVLFKLGLAKIHLKKNRLSSMYQNKPFNQTPEDYLTLSK